MVSNILRKKSGSLYLNFYSYIFSKSEELYHSLTQSLDEMKRRKSELEKEIARFENLCTMKEEDSDAHKNGEFSDSSASSTTLCENEMVFKLREEVHLN